MEVPGVTLSSAYLWTGKSSEGMEIPAEKQQVSSYPDPIWGWRAGQDDSSIWSGGNSYRRIWKDFRRIWWIAHIIRQRRDDAPDGWKQAVVSSPREDGIESRAVPYISWKHGVLWWKGSCLHYRWMPVHESGCCKYYAQNPWGASKQCLLYSDFYGSELHSSDSDFQKREICLYPAWKGRISCTSPKGKQQIPGAGEYDSWYALPAFRRKPGHYFGNLQWKR